MNDPIIDGIKRRLAKEPRDLANEPRDYEAIFIEELERIIADLVKHKNAAPFHSAAREFYERQLRMLRYTYDLAGGIIEDADPMNWGCYCRPLDTTPQKSSVVVPLPTSLRS